jgi:hypothetical protein
MRSIFLTLELTELNVVYEGHIPKTKTLHLLYLDCLKLIISGGEELLLQLQTFKIFLEVIHMEFGFVNTQ